MSPLCTSKGQQGWTDGLSLLSCQTVSQCAIVNGFATDHLGVSIDIVPPAAPYTGPGLWRLPTHLLNDDDIVAGHT